ncbi:hypothetical protein OsJ_13695 [Oryza sativa Japonica Group]|uniref:Uncharacterized protein n=1 Tax=Oryza sativa subsp. japonica TaxID=39947 RepID=B9FDI4_ORYSJ|nr:hypothetical protein OsJ_13695 [Oryza sativa Japonica Group]
MAAAASALTSISATELRSRRDAMRRVMASTFARSSHGSATMMAARSARERERDRLATDDDDDDAESFGDDDGRPGRRRIRRRSPPHRRIRRRRLPRHRIQCRRAPRRRHFRACRHRRPSRLPSAQPSPSSDPPPWSLPPSLEPSSATRALPIVRSGAAAFPTTRSGAAEPPDAAAAEPVAYRRRGVCRCRPSLSPPPLPSLSPPPSMSSPPSPEGEQGERASSVVTPFARPRWDEFVRQFWPDELVPDLRGIFLSRDQPIPLTPKPNTPESGFIPSHPTSSHQPNTT